MRRLCAVALILSLASAWSLRAAVPVPEPRPLALVGGLIRTQTDAGDFVGTIVVRDGKIVALGPNVAVPADARRIDVAGHVITPGLIDAHGTLRLNPAAARESGRDAGLNILDAVDPFTEDWRDVAAQGVTAVYVQPTGSGLLSGSGAVVRVGTGVTADDVSVKSPVAVQAALGATPPPPPATDEEPAGRGRGGRGGRGGAQPAAPAPAPVASNSLTRFNQYEQLRGQFNNARQATRRDAGQDLLVRVIKGELPLRLEVTHEDDLRNALKLTNDLKIRTVLERVDRVPVLPDELATSRVPLVLGPFYKATERRTVVTTAAAPAARGRGGRGGRGAAPAQRTVTEVKTGGPSRLEGLPRIALDGRRWAIGTFGDHPRSSMELRLHAAAAVSDGFPRDQVMRALTRGAAELLGVEDQLGSLAVGRLADFAVFAGDPLDPSVPTRLVMSQGAIAFEQSATQAVPSLAVEEAPSLADSLPPSYIIKTTKLLNPAGELTPGELHIENGKVVARISREVPIFDLGDAVVTPGLVAAHHPMFSGDTADADAGQLRAADFLVPGDSELRALRDNGFLTVVVAPGSQNVLAGRACAVRVGERALPVLGEIGSKFVLSSSARNPERFPASLAGQVEFVDDRLGGGESHTDLYLPPVLRTSLLAQRTRGLEPVRTGKQVALIEAHTRTEVRAALRLIADHKLRGVIVEPRGLDDVADLIRQAKVGVVTAPLRPADPERLRQGLAELGKTVPVMFGSGGAHELRATAGLLCQAGLPRTAARRGLTAEAALALGLPAGVGRLSPGDVADFVVWDGCPLDLGSRPLAVVASGQRVRRGS